MSNEEKTLDLEDITNMVMGLLVNRQMNPLQKRKAVREVLLVVFAAGQGHPVITKDDVEQELIGVDLSGSEMYLSDSAKCTSEGLEIRGNVNISTKELQAVVHWMINNDLYVKQKSKDELLLEEHHEWDTSTDEDSETIQALNVEDLPESTDDDFIRDIWDKEDTGD